MNIRGAIFDMDGTLIDSMKMWTSIGATYLRSVGRVPADDLNDVIMPMKQDDVARYFQEEYEVEDTVDDIVAGVNALVERFYRQEATLKPGAKELVERLHAEGVRMCVATNTYKHLAEAVLERCGILAYFEGVITCNEVGASKHRPDVYEAALALLETPRDETVVFEDALYAARTARDAGLSVIAVFDATEVEQDALRAVADHCVEDLREALPFL